MTGLNLSPALQDDVIEELSLDLDETYRGLLAGGASEAQAFCEALDALGDQESFQREFGRMARSDRPETIEAETPGNRGRSDMLAELWMDLRYGARMIRKSP